MRFVSLLLALLLMAGLSLGTVSFNPKGGEAGIATLDVCSKHLSAQTSDVQAIFDDFCLSFTPVFTSYVALPDDSLGSGPYLASIDRPPAA